MHFRNDSIQRKFHHNQFVNEYAKKNVMKKNGAPAINKIITIHFTNLYIYYNRKVLIILLNFKTIKFIKLF